MRAARREGAAWRPLWLLLLAALLPLHPAARSPPRAPPGRIISSFSTFLFLRAQAIPSTWAGAAVETPPGVSPASALRVELASTLALAVALVQVAMGVLRLGGLVSLISTPVVAGACAAPRRAAPRRR